MAQPPSKDALPDGSQIRSHGRGGAGNLNTRSTGGVDAQELSTPTLKSQNYTTGRGGSGNMVPNDPSNPAAARAAQDVDAPAHHEKEARGTFHWGRGGEGNMVTLGKSGAQEAREKSAERRAGSKDRARPASGLFDKGRELLGLGRKESSDKDVPRAEKASEPAAATK